MQNSESIAMPRRPQSSARDPETFRLVRALQDSRLRARQPHGARSHVTVTGRMHRTQRLVPEQPNLGEFAMTESALLHSLGLVSFRLLSRRTDRGVTMMKMLGEGLATRVVVVPPSARGLSRWALPTRSKPQAGVSASAPSAPTRPTTSSRVSDTFRSTPNAVVDVQPATDHHRGTRRLRRRRARSRASLITCRTCRATPLLVHRRQQRSPPAGDRRRSRAGSEERRRGRPHLQGAGARAPPLRRRGL